MHAKDALTRVSASPWAWPVLPFFLLLVWHAAVLGARPVLIFRAGFLPLMLWLTGARVMFTVKFTPVVVIIRVGFAGWQVRVVAVGLVMWRWSLLICFLMPPSLVLLVVLLVVVLLVFVVFPDEHGIWQGWVSVVTLL